MEEIIKKDIENGKAAVRKEIKVGIIKKCSFEPMPHMIMIVGEGWIDDRR